MKKILLSQLGCIVTAVVFVSVSYADASGKGACSSHGGVDCSVTDFSDGSVICNDGWVESSVSFEDTLKCSETTKNKCPYYYPEAQYKYLLSSIDSNISKAKSENQNMCNTFQSSRSSRVEESYSICYKYSVNLGEQNVRECDEKRKKDYELIKTEYEACTNSYNISKLELDYTKMKFCIRNEEELIPQKNLFCRARFGANSFYNKEFYSCACKDGTSLFNNQCVSNFKLTVSKSLKEINTISNISSNSSQLITKNKSKITNKLKVGSSGEEVRVLQRFLNLEETGYFGVKTKKALLEFQKKNGLQQTGVVGPATMNKLNSL